MSGADGPEGRDGGGGGAGMGGTEGGADGAAPALVWGRCCIAGGVPAVAVSLTGPTADHVRRQARRAARAGADVLELRVDLLEEVRRALGETPRPKASSLRAVADCVVEALTLVEAAAPGAPVLLTCRTAAEGGRAVLDDAGYAAVMRLLLDELASCEPRRRPAAVDIEVQRECLPEVAARARDLGVDVVGSFHDFEGTPADADLEEVLDRMVREGGDLAKIAVWPASAEDVARLLGVTARAAASLPVPVAAMSMGALGMISRVAAVFGSALTFAVVPDEEGCIEASAPGQLPIDEVRRCLSLLGGRPIG